MSDVRRVARSAVSSKGATEMVVIRRCAGSAKFVIEAHDAPVEDFPKQASQKDGLGRMCRKHWNEYTTALRKAAAERKGADGEVGDVVERKGADGEAADVVTATAADEPPIPIASRRGRRRAAPPGEVAPEGASD